MPRRRTGSITKHPNGSWHIRFTAGGHRFSRYLPETYTLRRAQAVLDNLVDASSQLDRNQAEMSVGLYARRWLIDQEADKPSTYKPKKLAVEYLLDDPLSEALWIDLQQRGQLARIRQFAKNLHGARQRRFPDKPISSQYRHNILAVTRAIFRQAYIDELINTDLWAQADIDMSVSRTVTKPEPYEAEDTARLLAAIRGYRQERFVKFVLYSQLRVGEAVARTWDDVDMKRRRFLIRTTFSAGTEGPTKTRGSKQWVDMHPALFRVLEEQMVVSGPNGLIFPGKGGRHLSPAWVIKELYTIQEAAGLPRLHLQGLRATGENLVADTTDSVTAATLSRHSLKVAVEHYQRRRPRVASRELTKIGALYSSLEAAGNGDS